MSSKQEDGNQKPSPKEIMPGQAYMHSPSSQIQRESSRQPPQGTRPSSSHQDPASSKDFSQSHCGSHVTSSNSSHEEAVEDEWLSLHAGPTPSAANAESESSHPIRRYREAAEEDPWTFSLEKSGGVDYYGYVSSASNPSKPSHSPASSRASIYHDAEEELSQKQESRPTSAQGLAGGEAKRNTKRSNEASGSSVQQKVPAAVDACDEKKEDYVFLT